MSTIFNISDKIKLQGSEAPSLLNFYGAAAAAYSLRRLDAFYSGSAVRVRRASDNAEQDIAFANNELDTATLETFASGTDAFVTTWYDQSGNGVNATQTTASAQPQIVSSGSTILENGKAAVDFDGVSNYFDVSLGTLKEVFTSFVSTPNTGSQIIGGENGAFGYSRENSRHRVWKVNSSTVNFSDFIVLPLTELITIDYSDSSNYSKLYRDGSLIGTEASLNISGNTTYIGQNNSGGAYIFNGSIQEIVFYTINKSLVRTGIETNINDFYSIY